MADFHFIRPWWLLALFLLVIALYLIKKLQVSASGWQQIIPSHLANKLIVGETKAVNHSLLIPFIIGFISIVALAGPTWEKRPQPVFNVQKSSVIIMDMSYSMYSTDVSPNRLTRARFKATDLLTSLNGGEIGLIAYAGDSFIISPLTSDINNIKLLLPALSPELMPVVGSNPLAALTMANEMLMNAGYLQGNIFWLTDDADRSDIADLNKLAKNFPHTVNILGIGTSAGAPIKLPSGELLKDNNGAIVLPHLPSSQLASLAQRFKGNYREIASDSRDIDYLLNNIAKLNKDKKEQESLVAGDQWHETGPYLLLLILPLVLYYFRRGILLSITLPCLFFLTTPTPSFAQQKPLATENNQASNALSQSKDSIWQDLWQTDDQQAQEKFNNQQYNDAAKQFTDPLWQGSAYYRDGKYQEALEAFQQVESIEALYNQANSLAKLQQFEESLNAYKEVLAKDPNHQAAKKNKEIIEKLLEQQQKQEQSQNEQESEQNGEQQKNEDGQESESDNSADKTNNEETNNGQNNEESGEEDQSASEGQQEQGDEENNKNNAQNSDEESRQENEANKQEDEQSSEAEKQASSAELSEQQIDDEEAQKHKQLLNKVTDDPYLLLRNKMRLEYKKRRHNNQGENKKW